MDYCYLSTDKDDPGLQHAPKSFFIGESFQAFYNFSKIKPGVVVMTTPGLDVLEIKKSKDVKHYIHIIHAPTDVAFYRLFSLDHYDSTVVNGPHQKFTIRHLEALWNTKQKYIYTCGSFYYDNLVEKNKGFN